MKIRDDVETVQIGRFTEVGRPELAAEIFRSRWRYRLVTRALVSLTSLLVPVVWYIVR